MSDDVNQLGRRSALVGLASVSACATLGNESKQSPAEDTEAKRAVGSTKRQPSLFLPHGGGPVTYVEFGVPKHEADALGNYWRGIAASLPERPRALLVVSAHWETKVPTVMTATQPPMLYDYFNFPPASYEIKWTAPGAPHVAAQVRSRLRDAGFDTAEDPSRGFDHGTFVPLGRIFPEADIPTLQLSLERSLDPSRHFQIGQALASLRDEGVLILGSGMSYHNMRGFAAPSANAISQRFDDWMAETVQLAPEPRSAALSRWVDAPEARRVHPREEHLLPLMVAAGAAGSDGASLPFRGRFMGKAVSAVRFG